MPVKASTPPALADDPPWVVPDPAPPDPAPDVAPEPEAGDPDDPDDPLVPPDGPAGFDPTDPVCPGEVGRGTVVGVDVADGSMVNTGEKIFGCEKSFWFWPM
jgi:hypothetical protein